MKKLFKKIKNKKKIDRKRRDFTKTCSLRFTKRGEGRLIRGNKIFIIYKVKKC